MTVHKLIIIGAGPAGYTAGVYAARANIEPVLIQGVEPGGQLMLTTEVENYPGFPDGIMGPDLMDSMRQQAEKFGTQMVSAHVGKVDFSQKPFVIEADGNEYKAQSVIVATGASARWLGLQSEKNFMGRGISACATCDGAFFKDKEVIVVGGGDTAMEEASFLTKFASKVYIVHRRDSFRASKIMQQRVMDNPKIEIIWNKVIEEFMGALKVTKVKLRDTQTDEWSEMAIDGVFLALGHDPNTQFLKGQIDMDETGYILYPDPLSTATNVPGVFGAGDVGDARYRQAITAAGSGCQAALDVERFLADRGIE